MAMDNIESSTFIQMYDKLSTGIRAALPSLAEVAFARQLIHDSTLSEATNRNVQIEVRTQSFLNVLRDRIRTDPAAFHMFVDHLDQQNSLEYLAKMLKESLAQTQKAVDLKRKQNAAAEKKLPVQEDEMVLTSSYTVAQSRPLSIPPASYDTSCSRATPEIISTNDYHHLPGLRHSNNPTQLPIYPANHSEKLRKQNYQKSFRTPESGMLKTLCGYAGSLSEPAVKRTAFSPAVAFTRHAISPAETSQRISSITELTSGHPTKIFRETFSELHLPDFSSMPGLSANSRESPKEYPYPTPLTSSDHSSNIESLVDKVAQISIDTSIRTTASTKNTDSLVSSTRSEANVVTSHFSANESTEDGDGYPSRKGQTATVGAKEVTLSTFLPHHKVQKQCGLNRDSGNEKAVCGDKSCHKSLKTVDKPRDSHDTSPDQKFATATPPEPSLVIPHTSLYNHSHNGSSGVKESQTTELGSNLISYSQISRHSSVLSSSSDESYDSSCDLPETDPIQASDQLPGLCHPLVSGRIMSAECSNKTGGKQKRQRCKQCSMLKKESISLREGLVKVERTLSREREQSNKQVNDLKEQLYCVEQQANYRFAQYVHDSEQRHQHAARTIQRLQRELQMIESEKAGLKTAYDTCLSRCEMMKAELKRADSLQCQDYQESYSSGQHMYSEAHQGDRQWQTCINTCNSQNLGHIRNA